MAFGLVMNAALDKFMEELHDIPGDPEPADGLCDWITSQRNEEFVRALTWIAAQPCGVVAKLDAIARLVALPGPVTVSMRELMAKR